MQPQGQKGLQKKCQQGDEDGCRQAEAVNLNLFPGSVGNVHGCGSAGGVAGGGFCAMPVGGLGGALALGAAVAEPLPSSALPVAGCFCSAALEAPGAAAPAGGFAARGFFITV